MRLGVVSFLNSRPLIEGLAARGDVELRFEVPAALGGLLESGAVDVALVPIIDVIRSGGRLRRVTDACIGCDGETMTVRVFSQDPPERIETLFVDGDSHTSIELARVLWREIYGRELGLRPLREGGDEARSVLLIGDKVVDSARRGFAYEIDLGGAWREHTGRPFAFAVWAARSGQAPGDFGFLEAARDAGVARAREIGETAGPAMGWPAALAVRYLTRCMKYRFDERMRAGAELFEQLVSGQGAAQGARACST